MIMVLRKRKWEILRTWVVLTLWRPLLRYWYSYKFLTSGHSECPDVKSYEWRLNPVWHRMLYSCTNMATVGVKGIILIFYLIQRENNMFKSISCCGCRRRCRDAWPGVTYARTACYTSDSDISWRRRESAGALVGWIGRRMLVRSADTETGVHRCEYGRVLEAAKDERTLCRTVDSDRVACECERASWALQVCCRPAQRQFIQSTITKRCVLVGSPCAMSR